MNIWNWVITKERSLQDAGEHRLAEIMDLIPSYTCGDQHHRVDMMQPEGVQLARRAKEPWVELFIRHWYLQSQVLHRHNVKGTLNEAVELLNFSHQDDTQECPQRICVVQDLTASYGIKDGPGYVEERLHASQEALDQIDPSWPCYICIASEYCSALLDAGRYEELIDRVEFHNKEVAKLGEEGGSGEMPIIHTRALIKNDRLDDAEELLERATNDGGGESFSRKKQQLLSLISALKGDYQKALDQSLSFDIVVVAQQYFVDWSDTYFTLAKGSAVDVDPALLSQFHYLAKELEDNGAIRMSLAISLQVLELSLDNHFLFSASIAKIRIVRLIPELRANLGASELAEVLFTRLTSALDAHQHPVNFDNVDDVLSLDSDNVDGVWLAFSHALGIWGDSVEIIQRLSEGYCYYSLEDEGLRLLSQAYRDNPSDEALQFQYGLYLLNNFGRDAFLKEFDMLDQASLSEGQMLNYLWLYSHAYYSSDKSKALGFLEQYLSINENSVAVIERAANISAELDNHSDAIGYWTQLIDGCEDVNSFHWQRMVSATIEQQWDIVHESSNYLDMEFEAKEGAIDEDMGNVLVKYSTEDQEDQIFLAQRRGPVSARITGIARVLEEQKYGDDIVFAPQPLNELDQEDDEGYACDSEGRYLHLFAVVKTTATRDYYTFAIDGVHPGDELLAQLKDALADIQCLFSQRNSEEYCVEFDEGDEEKSEPGLYAYVLAPPTVELDDVKILLSKICESLKHPLIWPSLLEKLGDDKGLAEQAAIEERYNL